MSFLHLSLLAGLGAVSVPLLLHLFGRRQPQLVDFPALRFVRETTQEQSMSWQLRHLLLLLLRALLFAAMALALARPRVHSALLGSVLTVSALGLCAALATLVAAVALVTRRPASVWLTAATIAVALWLSSLLWGVQSLRNGPSVPSSDQSAPVAAALIIDNSPTLEYRADNSTRLQAALDMSRWILEQLPIDSHVGLLTGPPVGSLALDPATAKSQLKTIQARGAHVDLPSRIRTALDLVLASELERKEIYVLSDLTSPAWSTTQSELPKLLEANAEQVLLQIIDLGRQESINYRLGNVETDFEVVPAGSEVKLTVAVTRTSSDSGEPPPVAESVTVELIQEQSDPRLPVISDGQLELPPQKVVDRQVVDLGRDGSGRVTLTANELAPGTHNFTIRLDKSDPLPIDNERYFTVVAQSQQPTLIVADDPQLARTLQAIVDPRAVLADAAVSVDRSDYTGLGSRSLSNYGVIALYDPPPMTSTVAGALEEHVRGGGGLLLILGPALGSLASAAGNPLTKLLPGTLGKIASRDPRDSTVFPEPVALSHPIFFAFGESPESTLWNVLPVYRNWTFQSLAEDAQTLMRLSDGSGPFLTLQPRGQGQILTLTTPVPEIDTRQRELWNLLWASDPVPAFAILLGSFRALGGSDAERFNQFVGQPITLLNDPSIWPSQYQLLKPDAQQERHAARDGMLSVGEFERAGIYRLRGQTGEPVTRGFSINIPAEDTNLDRITTDDLDDFLGRGNYRLAREREQVESSVGTARYGRDLYPLLMLLVAGLFLAEQAMSNRFYKIKFSR